MPLSEPPVQARGTRTSYLAPCLEDRKRSLLSDPGSSGASVLSPDLPSVCCVVPSRLPLPPPRRNLCGALKAVLSVRRGLSPEVPLAIWGGARRGPEQAAVKPLPGLQPAQLLPRPPSPPSLSVAAASSEQRWVSVGPESTAWLCSCWSPHLSLPQATEEPGARLKLREGGRQI